jgi:hypothetical protein
MTVPAMTHADPLAPVRATIAAMARVPHQPPVNGLVTGLSVADPTGWVRASALTSGQALDSFLSMAERRWDAAPHTAAALAWKSYTYWLALPAVLGFAASRRVPLLRPDAVLARWENHQPFVTLGLAAGAVDVAVLPCDPLALESAAQRQATRVRVVADDDALLAELRASLMDAHLTPMLAAIRERRHLGQRTLWGSLASGIAHGLSRAADVTPGPTLQTAQRVLTALGIDDLVELSARAGGGLTVERRTCCLAFTLPEPKICSGCCIR